MSDRIRTAPDVNFRPAGAGMQHLWLCMGCGKSRPSLGSRGTGVARRCASCLAARKDKAA